MDDAHTPLWRRLRDGWTAIAGRFAAVQTRVILAFAYLLLIGPTAIVQGLARSDHLDKRSPRGGGSAWRDAETPRPDLERAKRLS